MSKRHLLLLSSSAVAGYEYMKYCENDIKNFLQSHNVRKVLFIPYANFNYDKYAEHVGTVFKEFGFEFSSIHTYPDPIAAVNSAESFYVGGGNTFLLLKTLYEKNIISHIRRQVLDNGIPYMSASAGSNVATCTISTTNDMPIVYPPSFEALNLVPFNINPHYIDVCDQKDHKGETRGERIRQYHELDNSPPVLGMREGCILSVDQNKALIKGIKGAVLFVRGEKPKELAVDTDMSCLFNPACCEKENQ